MDDPLQGIVFVSLPEGFHHQIGTLTIPPDVMLPVDSRGDGTTWNPGELTWEMVIAGMIKVLAWQPDHEDAPFYRQFVLETRPDIIGDLTRAGIAQAQNDSFTMAEEIFRGVCGLVPEGFEGPVNLALLKEQRSDALRAMGRDTEADELAEEAAALYRDLLQREGPFPPDLHLNAGLFFLKIHNHDMGHRQLSMYLETGTNEEALERVRQILREVDLQNTQDRLFKESFDFIRMGQEERGIAAIKVFLEKNPDTWNGWFMLGWGHRRLHQYHEAQEAFERAVALGGDTADTLNELAICQMETGDLDTAYHSLDQALRKDPDNIRIISNFGVLYLKKGQTQEARQFFETVLALEPEDTIARQFLESLS